MGLFKSREEKFLSDVQKLYINLMDSTWAQIHSKSEGPGGSWRDQLRTPEDVRRFMYNESPSAVKGAVIQVRFNRGVRDAAYTTEVPTSYYEYFWLIACKRYGI